MFKKLKFIICTRPFIAFISIFIRIYCMTLRLQIVNEDSWKDHVKKGRRVLLCIWHQQIFSAICHFSNYAEFKPAVMISQSRDGELIAGVTNKCGWHTERGSSSRGGQDAMQAMIEHIKKYGLGAHILDGPTGPIGKVKAGAVKIAKESRAAIVPFYSTPEKAWFFNSWDRFMLPRPFSKVTLTFGDMIRFPEGDERQNFEDQRLFLENTMRSGLFRQ